MSDTSDIDELREKMIGWMLSPEIVSVVIVKQGEVSSVSGRTIDVVARIEQQAAEITALRDRLEKAEGALRGMPEQIEMLLEGSLPAGDYCLDTFQATRAVIAQFVGQAARAYFAAQESTP